MQEPRNIAARAGRWSARHRKTAIIGWIVFVVLAFMVGGNMGTETLTNRTGGRRRFGPAAQITTAHIPSSIGEIGPHPEQEPQDRRPANFTRLS